MPQALTTPPAYKKVNPADTPVLLLSVHSDTMPLIKVDEYANIFLAQQISQVNGVAQVSVFGDRTPSIRVQVDPAKLAANGLTLEEIRGTLVSSTTNAAKGVINTDKITFTIAANDQITDADKFNDVVLAYRNGAPIRVRDVGQAVSEQVDRTVAAYQNNKDGVILAVFKQPGANVIDTVDQIKAELPQLAARIPPAVKVETILDRTVTIRASVTDVEFTLMLTICLVVMVILLFLRNFWATLIPSVTVPLALAGSFAAMYLMNFSLDNLSLMALTIAVGFVVDDAIVVVENIYRHVEHGEPPFTAALKGSREIGFTVLSISCSLIAVFIPLLLMSGIIGRLFREFALTVTASIAVSALVSLTLAPMMCSRFMKREPETHGRIYRVIESGFTAMVVVLPAHARHRAAPPADHARRVFRHHGADGGHGDRDPERLFPDPGYRNDSGLRRSRAGNLAERDDAADAQHRRRHPARSRRRRFRLVHRLDRQRAVGQYRPLLHRAQAARRAQPQLVADHRPAAAATCQDRRASICSCSRRRTSMSARASPAAAFNTPAGHQYRRVERVVAEAVGEAAHVPQLADVTSDLAGERAEAADHHQSRPGRAFRHIGAGDRRYAQRRLRPAPDHAIFHPAQDLLRGPGNPARPAKGPLDARSALRQIAADRRRGAAVVAGRPSTATASGRC